MTPRKYPKWATELVGSIDHTEPELEAPAEEASEASPEPAEFDGLSDYERLTIDEDELAERAELQEALTAAEGALAGVVAEREAIDAQLEVVEAKRVEREQLRAAETSKRDHAADDADVQETAAAEAMLAGLAAIDHRQAGVAEALVRRRAELADRDIPAAEVAVEAARGPLAEWDREHVEQVPRWLVDWAFEYELKSLRDSQGGRLLGPAESADVFAENLRYKPDAVARRVAADMDRYVAWYRAAMQPAPPMTAEEAEAMVDRGMRRLAELKADKEGRKAAAWAYREQSEAAGARAAADLSPRVPDGYTFTVGGGY